MRHVERSARRLLTVDIDPIESDGVITNGPDQKLDGAIVRVRPTKWVEPELLSRFEQEIHDAGAFAVKVMPCPPKGEVVVADTERQPRRSLREVVSEMVDQAKGIDTDALRAMVEEIMGAEGL